jgi:pimeloyl-ACP methyl ester carboxylesterase
LASIFEEQAFSDRLFFPGPDHGAPPAGAADLLLPVGPGVRLHVRAHAAAGARVLVVHFHGNGEVNADLDPLAPLFARVGARLVAVDYRGYGRSEGRPTLRDVMADGLAVVPPILAALGSDLPLVLHGRSLGCAPAVEAARGLGDRVAGLIIEAGYSDLAALVRRRGLPVPPITPADEAAFGILPRLRAVRAPLLILHGRADDQISPREAEAAKSAAGARDKRLVLVRKAAHGDLLAHPGSWRAIAAFLAHLCLVGRHPTC